MAENLDAAIQAVVIEAAIDAQDAAEETTEIVEDLAEGQDEWTNRLETLQADFRLWMTQTQAPYLEALQKQLKKKGVPVPEAVGTMILPEELANRPAPKVVDTTVPSNEPVVTRRRPSLAELHSTEGKAKAAPASPAGAASTWEDYVLPGLDLLEEHSIEARTATDPSELQEVQQVLIETLAQFGIAVAPGDFDRNGRMDLAVAVNEETRDLEAALRERIALDPTLTELLEDS